MAKPPALGSPRFFRILWMILREAQLGGRLLCVFGIHKWDIKTETNPWTIRDYHRCKRPFCHYREWMLVNQDRARRII